MPDTELPYAEDVNYWKTSRSDPDTWIQKARIQIEDVGGIVHEEAFGRQGSQSAFMLGFELEGESYRISWPVLESCEGNQLAERRQAATFIYHDVKARCMVIKIKGPRVAFFEYAMLPDGRVAGQLANAELMAHVPKMLTRNA